MLRNYLATALRNLVRNPFYAAINIVGLAVACAAAVLIALFVRDEVTYNEWIPGHERTFLVYSRVELPSQTPMASSSTFSDVAAWLSLDFPEVDAATRVVNIPFNLRRGALESAEQGAWVDPNFFDVIPFPAIAGDISAALKRPDGLVLTRSVARKYFGRDDPVGETLELDRVHPMQVMAVIEDLPSNTTITRTIFASSLASFSKMAEDSAATFSATAVQSENYSVYVRLKTDEAVTAVREGLVSFPARHLPSNVSGFDYSKLYSFALIPLADIHLLSPQRFAMTPTPDLATVGAAAVIGVVLVLVAVINFVNLVTARAVRRAVEVGVRKATGAFRHDLLLQFIGETFVYVAFSAMVGLTMAHAGLPFLNSFMVREIAFASLAAPAFIVSFAAALLLTALIAGFYPAFILSSFRPAVALKKNASGSGTLGWLRQSLVALQFAVLIGLLLGTAVLYRQIEFASRERMRVPGDHSLIIAGACEQAAFRARLATLPGVRAAACSDGSSLYYGRTGTALQQPDGTIISIRSGSVEPGFLELYGLQPTAGRFPGRDRPSDTLAVGEDARNPPIVINETAARKLGFARPADAVGQFVSWVRVLDYSGRMGATLPSEIIGVAPDFALRSVRQEVEPTFYFSNPGWYSYASVRLEGAALPETLAAIDRAWLETGAARPITRLFVDQRMQQLYADITRSSAMLAVFAGITVLISCFGLLGLSALVAERRTKEIGIRKAMGAGKVDLLRLLLWEFTKPVLWANLIAWPVAYFVMRRWLEGFAYHFDLSPWMFLAASAAALLIAVATVIGHALLVARAQPVTALRYE